MRSLATLRYPRDLGPLYKSSPPLPEYGRALSLSGAYRMHVFLSAVRRIQARHSHSVLALYIFYVKLASMT